MKDYSVFYQKYKGNKQMKKHNKNNERIENLKKDIEDSYKIEHKKPEQKVNSNDLKTKEDFQNKIIEFFDKSMKEIVQNFKEEFLKSTQGRYNQKFQRQSLNPLDPLKTNLRDNLRFLRGFRSYPPLYF